MKIDKLKKFIQDNYKLIIPIALLLVLFIAFLIYYKISIANSYHEDTTEDVYQYFYDNKYEYKATVSKNKKGVIVDFKPQKVNINLDSTPIYYKDEDIAILPHDMSVVMPIFSCAEYLSSGYSYITYNKKTYNLTTLNYSNPLNHYFLYDGENLYFFIEEVTLNINNEKISLTPFSYVIAKPNNYITYYDYKNDVFKTIEVTNNDSKIYNDYYTIYPSLDSVDYYGTDVLLTSDVSKLNTIDKKD